MLAICTKTTVRKETLTRREKQIHTFTQLGETSPGEVITVSGVNEACVVTFFKSLVLRLLDGMIMLEEWPVCMFMCGGE